VNDGFLVGPRFRFGAQQRVKTFVQLTAGVDQARRSARSILLTRDCASPSTRRIPKASGGGTPADPVDASCQVGLINGRNLQVRLEVFDGRIRDTISGLSQPIAAPPWNCPSDRR
jgi:hypothetical protein